MRKQIYYTSCNNGDGSSSTEFFESQDCINLLEEHDPESYAGGEGGSSFTVVEDGGWGDISEILPDLRIRTMVEIKAQIKEGLSYR